MDFCFYCPRSKARGTAKNKRIEITPAEMTAIKFMNELNSMAWQSVVKACPEREQELRSLWTEILQAANSILLDPGASAELWRRVEPHWDWEQK